MKQRSLVAVALLSFLTFGLYDLYWLYVTRKEIVAKGHKVPAFFILLLPFAIVLAAGMLLLIGSFLLGLIDINNEYSDRDVTILIILIVLSFLAAIASAVTNAIWTYHYCKAAEAATGGHLNFTRTYVLNIALYIFGFWFIWPVIVQDSFNRFGGPVLPQPSETPQAPTAPFIP